MMFAGRSLRKGLVVIATITGMTAFAGTHLHLKSGTIETKKATQVVSLHSYGEGAGLFVVQFSNKIGAQEHQILRDLNIEVHRYLPDDAFLVYSTSDQVSRLAESPRIQGVLPYLPEFRISPSLVKPNVFNKNQIVDLTLVMVNHQAALRAEEPLRQKEDLVLNLVADRYIKVKASVEQIGELARLKGLMWMESTPQVETMVLPLQPDSSAQIQSGDYKNLTGFETGTKIMKFDQAWARGYTGKGQVVAVGDTGLDLGGVPNLHVDFKNNVGGKPYGLFGRDWSDPMGHGTHVSGSVMSSGEASGGHFKGGAHEAAVFTQGLWSPMLNNLSIPTPLSKLFKGAEGAGAAVQTNSWGSQSKGAYDNMSAQVDEYMWNNPDLLIVFAAGNSGRDDDKNGRIDPNSVASPGTAKNALTVGASENYLLDGGIQRPLRDLMQGKPWSTEPLASDTLSNNENGVAAFSSIGPTNDGRRKPDIVAPGTNIVSNCSQKKGASPLWGNYNKDYCYSGGTSMSTPLTAGAAAVARQFLIKKGVAKPTSALVKGLLLHTAFDMYPGQYGEVGRSRGQELLQPGPNNNQGYGRVDMARLTEENAADMFVDERQGVGAGEVKKVVFANSGFNTVRVTLVYNDYPGAPSARKTLVNDLDIEVVDGSGKTFNNRSNVNNNEQVVIKGVAPGALTIHVRGANVPQGRNGKQPYALLVSGR